MPATNIPRTSYNQVLSSADYPSGGALPSTWAAYLLLTGYAALPNARMINPPEPSVDDVDISTLATKWREYIPGFGEPGTFEFEILYTEVNHATLDSFRPDIADEGEDKGRRIWGHRFPDGSGFVFIGYVKTLGVRQSQVDNNPVVSHVTLKVSGEVKWIQDAT